MQVGRSLSCAGWPACKTVFVSHLIPVAKLVKVIFWLLFIPILIQRAIIYKNRAKPISGQSVTILI
ncbi:MAG: hypothetical protein DYG89_25820 [Caldilinea sp. CFX5]|nr:hypothetical protein [Caldilinea sp. CFX5]